MKAQMYHTPSFHLRERRYVRSDYARAFRLWYDRHRHEWWLPRLTPPTSSSTEVGTPRVVSALMPLATLNNTLPSYNRLKANFDILKSKNNAIFKWKK